MTYWLKTRLLLVSLGCAILSRSALLVSGYTEDEHFF